MSEELVTLFYKYDDDAAEHFLLSISIIANLGFAYSVVLFKNLKAHPMELHATNAFLVATYQWTLLLEQKVC